ncbi:hypothetical protein ACFQRB_09420 [Halobaculum litoreum]|uniref:Uncharacterized protein n=1 Tax=Halobaculum litoreum TaxID=3031998 RepID=A0ABD5XS69_9EURY
MSGYVDRRIQLSGWPPTVSGVAATSSTSSTSSTATASLTLYVDEVRVGLLIVVFDGDNEEFAVIGATVATEYDINVGLRVIL